MSSNSRDLGRLTASWTLEKCGANAFSGLAGGAAGQLGAALTNPTPTNNRPGSFLNPGGVQPGGGGALPGTQQQRQQAMQNPVFRQQYIEKAKADEQQRIQLQTGQYPQGSPTWAAVDKGVDRLHGRQPRPKVPGMRHAGTDRPGSTLPPAAAARARATTSNPQLSSPPGGYQPGSSVPGIGYPASQ